MRKIDRLFAEYAESHRNTTNKTIHWICVPLIFFSILGFISLIPAPHVCGKMVGCISIASIITVFAVSFYYFSLSWRMGILMFTVMILLEHLAYRINIGLHGMPFWIYLGIFILSWLGQFYGHKIEGRKPSFLKDIQFLLIGPIWLLSLLMKKFSIRF